MDQEPTRPPLDGITAPAKPVDGQALQKTSAEPASGKTKTVPVINRVWIIFGLIAAAYVLPALFFMSVLPTPDGSLQQVKLMAMAMYGLGLSAWLGFGFIGFLRVSSFKERPRQQMYGLIRLFLLVIPMLFVSVTTLLLINREPTLLLDVATANTVQHLVAPVTLKFSTTTAGKIFAQQGLSPQRYQWDFNADGAFEQDTFEPESSYIFQRAGIYPVSVVVTMSNGVKKSVSRRVAITKTSFIVEPESPVIDESVRFSIANIVVKKEDILKAQWDFDADGAVDLETTKLDASFKYHTLGSVTPSVTILFANNTQQKITRTIDIVTPPPLPFPITLETEPSTLLSPPPFGVRFTLNTQTPIANVTWNFGDNTNPAEGLVVQHIYSTVGTFSATATVRSQSGAIARIVTIVQVAENLSIPDLTFDGAPAVRGDVIQGEVPLTVNITPKTSQPLITFTWEVQEADEIQSTDRTLTAVFRKQGRYAVDLIASDPDNKVLRKRYYISVQPASSVVAFTMDPQAPESPALVQFDASDTYIDPNETVSGFEWDFGDSAQGNKLTGLRVQHLFSKPGSYTIVLRVKTTNGNIYTGQKTLVVRESQIRSCIDASRTRIKAGSAVSFKASSCSTGEFVSWLWDFGDKSQSDLQDPPPHVFSEPGEYTVILAASLADGRRDTTRTTIFVTP